MKILFILDKPNLYGSERHVFKLMKALKEDYNVSLLAFDDGPLLKLLESDDIPFTIIRLKWYPTAKLQLLFKFLKANQFDIIHAHQPKAAFWSSIIAKLAFIPSVITIHSLPTSNIQSYKNLISKTVVGVFHYSVKFISELFADKVIYLSRFSNNHAFFKKKTLIIPNWIDEIKDELLIKKSNNTIHFISVGSVTFNKGMDRIIEALALIKNEHWSIKIVGGYSFAYKKKLIDLANKYGISARIEFTGFMENINQMMLESDGFILLSRGETFGLVYLEAMNCGLPIIAWNIPVVKEILPPGNIIMSKFSDIKQVFTTIYSSQENYQKLSLTNRNFVKANFSFDKIYLKYRHLYDQVLLNNRN